MIASNLTQAEVGALAELFRAADKNSDGHITLMELDDAIAHSANQRLSQELQRLRHDLEVSDEERLNWRDFLALTVDRNLAVREDNIKMAFEHFKQTDADYLTESALSEIFGGDAQANEMMTILDADGDGKVSFEDFRRALVESMEEDDHNDEDSAFHG